MSKWYIQLRNIGRNKIAYNIETEANTLPQAERIALRECKDHLENKQVELIHVEDLSYYVFAGAHRVGTVTIRTLQPQEPKS